MVALNLSLSCASPCSFQIWTFLAFFLKGSLKVLQAHFQKRCLTNSLSMKELEYQVSPWLSSKSRHFTALIDHNRWGLNCVNSTLNCRDSGKTKLWSQEFSFTKHFPIFRSSPFSETLGSVFLRIVFKGIWIFYRRGPILLNKTYI